MAHFITSQSEIPKAPYYVVMDDTFFSGWGPTEGKTATYINTCANYREAEIVADNARTRGDQKRVRITSGKPKLSRGHVYQVKTKADAPRWYEAGYFAEQVLAEKKRRLVGGKKRHGAKTGRHVGGKKRHGGAEDVPGMLDLLARRERNLRSAMAGGNPLTIQGAQRAFDAAQAARLSVEIKKLLK